MGTDSNSDQIEVLGLRDGTFCKWDSTKRGRNMCLLDDASQWQMRMMDSLSFYFILLDLYVIFQ
jgi:hypothetical protein